MSFQKRIQSIIGIIIAIISGLFSFEGAKA